MSYRRHYYGSRYADSVIAADAVGDAIGCLWPLIKRVILGALAWGCFNLLWETRGGLFDLWGLVPALGLASAFIVLATLIMNFSQAPMTSVFKAVWVSFVQSWYPRIAAAVWLVAWLLAGSREPYAMPVFGPAAITQLVALLFIAFYSSFQFRADEYRIDAIATGFRTIFGLPLEVFVGRSFSKVSYAVEIPHYLGAVDPNSDLAQKIRNRFPKYEVTFQSSGTIWLTLIVANHFAPIWRVTKAGANATTKGAQMAKRKWNDRKRPGKDASE